MVEPSTVDVIKADPKLRRFILAFLLGLATFSWLGIHLSQRLQHLNSPSLSLKLIESLLLLSALTIAGSLVVFGIWVGRIGIVSLREGCYPPSNSSIMCDTLLVTGWRATVKALAALMLASASLLSALGLSVEIRALINL